MITKKVISYLDYMIPLDMASKWDNCGIQTPIYSEIITNMTFTLDVTFELIEYCIDNDINFIISHHPLYLNDQHKKNVYNYKILKLLEASKIMVYSSHTNLDNIENGLNDYIIHKLGYKTTSKLTDEVGVIFEISKISIENLAKKFNKTFNIDTIYYKNSNKMISKVGFCSGSAGSMYNDAIMKGCDVFVTGDLKYHEKMECEQIGFNLIDVSHTIEEECINYFNSIMKKYKE